MCMYFRYGETIGHLLAPFRSWLYGFGLPKDSMFTRRFGDIIRRMTEAGLDQKWKRDEMDKVL